jgi:hypothetical protein
MKNAEKFGESGVLQVVRGHRGISSELYCRIGLA